MDEDDAVVLLLGIGAAEAVRGLEEAPVKPDEKGRRGRHGEPGDQPAGQGVKGGWGEKSEQLHLFRTAKARGRMSCVCSAGLVLFIFHNLPSCLKVFVV